MSKQEIFERITSNSDICHGKPCIKGTRIPVYIIVELVADFKSYYKFAKHRVGGILVFSLNDIKPRPCYR